ncbi:hypothetical protein [Orenia marismortui]|uniref:hypothetical protein n=1 Tax=Orenia marismortui TaxID=46469 RepID=UPI0012FAD368|nr:hypothetical protein [Orenia marismortui]
MNPMKASGMDKAILVWSVLLSVKYFIEPYLNGAYSLFELEYLILNLRDSFFMFLLLFTITRFIIYVLGFD